MVDVDRRSVLMAGIGLGLGIGLESRMTAGQDGAASARPKEGDLLIKSGDASKTPLTPGDIPLGAAQTMAWAMDPKRRTVRSGSRLNQLLLLRIDPGKLSPETRTRPRMEGRTVICTHTGCDVDDWLADNNSSCPVILRCSIRKTAGASSMARAANAAALPLKIVDAKLVVAKPFTAPVGFEKG